MKRTARVPSGSPWIVTSGSTLLCLACRSVLLAARRKSGRGMAAELAETGWADRGRSDVAGGVDDDQLLHGDRVTRAGHLRT